MKLRVGLGEGGRIIRKDIAAGRDLAQMVGVRRDHAIADLTQRLEVDVADREFGREGAVLEFGELRDILVKRPDQARIEQTASDGRRDLLLFDGERITVLDAGSNVFAQAPAPGEDLDDAIHYVLDSLGLRVPLAPMLMASFPEVLRQHVVEADLVETTDLLGSTADHIAARTQEVDFQVWVAQGEQPWPLRIVITYRLLPGSPQFRANLSEWNRSPGFNQQTFVFKQPAGATQIPFAAQLLTAPTVEEVDAASAQGGKP